ncbi:MAG: cupin domain-containing protein [Actinomycetota bacterium]
MTDPLAAALRRFPIHLGKGAVASFQEEFTGDPAWYERYSERNADDGADGWLVSYGTFTEPWTVWEMHPNGHEIVFCTEGEMTLTQEHVDGSIDEVHLEEGDAAINPPGTWHTADVDGPATCLFVTAGLGTEHRPR